MDEVEKYIVAFEPQIQSSLRQLRGFFLKVLPEVKECIRYKMPAYRLGEVYLYFAAYKKHIGFYPVYNLKEIEGEILPYRAKGTKDSLHFHHNKPLPIELIETIIRLKLEQQKK